MTTAALCLPYEVLYPPGCFGELDEWLRRRVLHTPTLMEQRPASALSGLGESRAERVGAYRMVNHEEVEFGRLLKPALETVGAAVARGEAGSVALCIHDRTEVELSHLKTMKGLGQVSTPAAGASSCSWRSRWMCKGRPLGCSQRAPGCARRRSKAKRKRGVSGPSTRSRAPCDGGRGKKPRQGWGWLLLWRGYERLRERVEGFLLARSLDSSPA